MKSQKIVRFPFVNFTPSDYVVPCDGASQSLKTSTDVVQTGEDINSNGINVTSRNVSRDGARRTHGERRVNGRGTLAPDQRPTTGESHGGPSEI